jgi:hypothetical protein
MDVYQIVHNPADSEQVMANLLQIQNGIQDMAPTIYFSSTYSGSAEQLSATAGELAELCDSLTTLVYDMRSFLAKADSKLEAADRKAAALLTKGSNASGGDGK